MAIGRMLIKHTGEIMGQGECLKYLKESGCWVKTKEIAEALGQNRCNISVPLKSLFDHDEVDRRMFKQAEGYEWKIK